MTSCKRAHDMKIYATIRHFIGEPSISDTMSNLKKPAKRKKERKKLAAFTFCLLESPPWNLAIIMEGSPISTQKDLWRRANAHGPEPWLSSSQRPIPNCYLCAWVTWTSQWHSTLFLRDSGSASQKLCFCRSSMCKGLWKEGHLQLEPICESWYFSWTID